MLKKNIGDSSSLLGEHSIALLHYYHAFFVCFLNLEGEEGGGEMRRLGGDWWDRERTGAVFGRAEAGKQTDRQAGKTLPVLVLVLALVLVVVLYMYIRREINQFTPFVWLLMRLMCSIGM